MNKELTMAQAKRLGELNNCVLRAFNGQGRIIGVILK